MGLAACVLFRPPDRTPEIAPALGDLRAAGFEFAPDVRLRNDPRAVCDGISCADLVVEANHRTILVADGAFASPSKLRASLLEIWVRYSEPRRGNARDLARAALVVIRDGPRAGVTDPGVLGDARFTYRQLWERLPAEKRAGLPAPTSLSD
ncbi:MAG TPA: hypothetical protein VKF60_15725 [Myxococcota bacterium]|nr:hypothetical protein [Myxococcota bacterium]